MNRVFTFGLIGQVKVRNAVFLFLFGLISILEVSGCASTLYNPGVLAIVDNEPVTTADLEYSLEIAHRVENLSAAKTLDIAHYIHNIIDERLVVQEAGRMGLDDYPEVREKIQAYLVRESVVLLHDEEVLKKVSVTENEILSRYIEDYEGFTIDIVEVDTEDDALKILDQLEGGAQFAELSREHPSKIRQRTEKGYVFKRKELGPAVRDIIAGMKPGDYTDPIKDRGKYIIITLIERKQAEKEGLDAVHSSIESDIRNQKIRERENEYLEALREKADININEEILSAINISGDSEERKKWMHDTRPVVDINGEILKTGAFAAKLSSSSKKIKERTLNAWIDRKIVDHEALGRHYEMKSPLKDKLHRYRNNLLQNEFTNRVIVPRVNISEDEVRDYYAGHRREYLKPVKLKLQQITLNSREEADDVLNSLRGGASFAWLVKKKSTDEYASKGGSLGWKTKNELEEPVRRIVDTLNPGDTSEVIEVGSVFRILRLHEESEEEFMGYENVKSDVRKRVFKKKYDEIYKDYIITLKKEADIRINDSAIKEFTDIFDK